MSHLTKAQRYTIATLFATNQKQKDIAKELGVSPSTVNRELSRNSTKGIGYEAETANTLALERHKRKPYKLTEPIIKEINNRLEEYESPEQIVGRCKLEGIPMVNHETIYQYVYSTKGTEKCYTPYLRWNRKRRKKRSLTNKKRGQIPNKVMIDERDEVVEDRNRIGDYEIDTVILKGRKGVILTVVDRTTRFTYTALLPNREANTIKEALIKLLKNEIVETITSDNGKEFADHLQIARFFQKPFYFAHPYSSWERGTNENTNGLLRQFIPKNRDFESITSQQLFTYNHNLNNRPRKCLGYKTPTEVLNEMKKNLNLKIAFES